jgi:hypothetical protein
MYLMRSDSLVSSCHHAGATLAPARSGLDDVDLAQVRLAGSIFFLMLRNAAGLVTDSFPFGTFRVDNPQ